VVHEGVQYIARSKVHAYNVDWRENTLSFVLIEALECDNCQLIVLAVESVPCDDLGALIEAEGILIATRYEHELGVGVGWLNSTCELCVIDPNQNIERSSAGELTTVIEDGPLVGRGEEVCQSILVHVLKSVIRENLHRI
jgi:hypothetical protein